MDVIVGEISKFSDIIVLDIFWGKGKKGLCIHTSDACASFKYPKNPFREGGKGGGVPLHSSIST
jgi:hypothetical protein